jgi:hypothetical protein
VRTVPRLCEVYPAICLIAEEKARKNLSQGSRRMPHYECVSVPLVIQQANRMFSTHIVICDLSGSTIIFHIIPLTERFSEKKLWNTKCLFWYSVQLLSVILHSLRRIKRDITNVQRSSCKLSTIIVRFLQLCGDIFKKIILKYKI